MIVIDKPKLKFLLAGRTLEINVPRTETFRYRTNHYYSVGTSHKRSVCRVKVLSAISLGDEWELRVVKAEMDTPVFLRKVSGYTTDPAQALRGEPEPVRGSEQKAYAAAARENDNLRHIVPAFNNLSRIDRELGELRAVLGANGRVDRELHQDLVRLERAKERLIRRLAS